MTKQLHIKISGQVQGVNFRYYTIELARQLNLVGWVKNTEDGGVEISAQGEENNLQKLLEWAYHGPSSARVEDVEFEWGDGKDNFDGFRVIL